MVDYWKGLHNTHGAPKGSLNPLLASLEELTIEILGCFR